jgi:PAS domain S-box-containing protein
MNNLIFSPPLTKILDHRPLIVSPDTPVQTVLNTMYNPDHRINHHYVLIMEDDQLLGIFTERDVVRLVALKITLAEIPIAIVMTKNVITITESEYKNIFELLNLFKKHHIRRLPVTDQEGKIIGVITQESLREQLQPINLLKVRLVKEAMTTNVVTASPTTCVFNLVNIMAKKSLSCIIICEPNSDPEAPTIPIGIITEKNILQAQIDQKNLYKTLASEIMTTPLICVHYQDTLWTVKKQMQVNHIRRLVVLGDHEELLGVITQTDLISLINHLELYTLVAELQKKIDKLEQENNKLKNQNTPSNESPIPPKIDTCEYRLSEIEKKAHNYQLLTQLTNEIRKAVNIKELLHSIAQKIRKLFAVERVFIYKFNEDWSGKIVAESKAEYIESILHKNIDNKFLASQLMSDYFNMNLQAISDINNVNLAPKYRQILQKLNIRAKLIVPVLIQNQEVNSSLWGFICVTQCKNSRLWENTEIELLEQLSAQISMSIYKSELYSQLKQSEKNLHTIINEIADGILIIDQKGQVKFANPAAYKILTVSPYKMSKNYLDLTNISEKIQEISLIKNQRQTYIEIRLNPAYWQGELVSIASLRDITERKETELALKTLNEELEMRVQQRTELLEKTNQELKEQIIEIEKMSKNLAENENRYRLIADNANDIISKHNLDGTYIYLSPSTRTILGYNPEELIGKSPYNLFHVDDLHKLEKYHQFLLTNGENSSFSYRILCANGQYIWLETISKLIYNSDGEPSEIIAISRDITQRKETEQALIESEARFRLTLQNSPISVFTQDIELKYTWMYHSLTNASFYTTKNKTDYDLFLPEDAEKLTAIKRQVLITKTGTRQELTLNIDGEQRYLDVSYEPLFNSQGEIIGITGASTDITERIKGELELKKSLREKELLLKEIHHRVKNNLFVVSNLLEFQTDHIDDPKLIKIIKDSQDRIYSMALIHEQLYKSINLDKINFGNYISSLVENLFTSYNNNNLIQLELNIQDIDLNIETANPCGLIVNELISNALKHAFPDGRSGIITIDLYINEKGQINLIVTDNGIGLPKGINYNSYDSLGIELIVTLTKQIKGNIIVESYPNQGSKFILTFLEVKYRQRW